jgi:hypothetical protein
MGRSGTAYLAGTEPAKSAFAPFSGNKEFSLSTMDTQIFPDYILKLWDQDR